MENKGRRQWRKPMVIIHLRYRGSYWRWVKLDAPGSHDRFRRVVSKPIPGPGPGIFHEFLEILRQLFRNDRLMRCGGEWGAGCPLAWRGDSMIPATPYGKGRERTFRTQAPNPVQHAHRRARTRGGLRLKGAMRRPRSPLSRIAFSRVSRQIHDTAGVRCPTTSASLARGSDYGCPHRRVPPARMALASLARGSEDGCPHHRVPAAAVGSEDGCPHHRIAPWQPLQTTRLRILAREGCRVPSRAY